MSCTTNNHRGRRGTTGGVEAESRDVLRGEGERVLDILAETYTSRDWAALLKVTLEHAVAQGDAGLSQKLVRAGAKIGRSLHAAVRGGHEKIVESMLESGASPDGKDGLGDTALHSAAKFGRSEIARLLLLKGADKDALDRNGSTPLRLAVGGGFVPMTEILLIAGANFTLRLSGRYTSPLDVAASCGHVEILKLLIHRGADVNACTPEGDRTALHYAASHSKTGAIDVLVEAGADKDARDHRGYTPLHIAVFLAQLDFVRSLLRHGADVNAQGNPGSTPLHVAAGNVGSGRAAEMVDLLLRWGADETIANERHETAADVVEMKIKEGLHIADGAERMRKLLANAPADRAWRRRGLAVLCRARPGRVSLGCSWVSLVGRVAELGEEDMFRKIVGYL